MAYPKTIKSISALLIMTAFCLAAVLFTCNSGSSNERPETAPVAVSVLKAVKHLTEAPVTAENQSIRNSFIRSCAQRASTGSSDGFSDVFYILAEFSGVIILLSSLPRTGFVIMCRKGLSVLALSIGGNSPPAFLK